VDANRESNLVGPAPQVTSYHIHFDRPASFLINNLGQEITGWIAAPKDAIELTPEFMIDGVVMPADVYRRADVEARMPAHVVIGWTLRLGPSITFRQPRRTAEFSVRFADRWSYSRRYLKSRSLMSEGRDGPLYFMHIPKTAGTALRQFTDFAFSEFPTMLVYGHEPGILPEDVAAAYGTFSRTRELFFGHFDFDLTRRLGDANPKVITVFREPSDLVRSYLNFSADPLAEFLDNPLVRHVCGLSSTSPPGLITGEHFEEALGLIDRNFYVIQQGDLQRFADEVTTTFGLPHFEIPRINVTETQVEPLANAFSVDLRYDMALYERCAQHSRSFVEFLDS
jgi:hypothetical protein